MIKLISFIVSFVLFAAVGYANPYQTPVTVCYAYDPWQPMQYRIAGDTTGLRTGWMQIDDYEQRFTLPYTTYWFQTKWGEDNRVFHFDLLELGWTTTNPIEWIDIDFWRQTDPNHYYVGFEWIQNDTFFTDGYSMEYNTVPEPCSLYLIGLVLLRRKR